MSSLIAQLLEGFWFGFVCLWLFVGGCFGFLFGFTSELDLH